eukprot:CAMPEP_0194763730 /NCGR_PEP_ID=MMETSP0323_2-20130528/20399_1 /TAXON_ID=2866 ORGANISM="Crypthecodinium cohnii, Strain Seligo" /NCGR_SAMPLE_ID=MMETSP0323_2 /ASSEMBLY_ACC=CAM_ASM_000346 /LENGTH=98 /DNA_ID=CAMNT_0039689219 /DNA_START=334 /DNA_END=627 /DNA_ORIENTATION=-
MSQARGRNEMAEYWRQVVNGSSLMKTQGETHQKVTEASLTCAAQRQPDDSISDLGGHIRDGTGTVRQEDSLSLGTGGDVAKSLKVLGDEQQFGDLLGA